MTAEAGAVVDTRRLYHFGAGPAMLPPEVIAEIRAELPDFRGTGVSILELGHRTPAFRALMREIEAALRVLLGIPQHYAVLCMQGGAALQFATVPLNLGGRGAYLISGQWSLKAFREAAHVAHAHIAWDGKDNGYTQLPEARDLQLPQDATYLHYTVNETIAGVEFQSPPADVGLPLVADMTSMILSRPIDIAKHALLYASAQKNLGIAGITLVVLDPGALQAPRAGTPSLLDYRVRLAAESLPNTPPVFAWYVLGKMLDWTRAQGGPEALAVRNRHKADTVYAVLDGSGFYLSRVQKSCRSRMNIPFRLRDSALEPVFLQEAEAAGLKYLAGHRSTGGIRASLYNAMPEVGAAALADFMREFERRHG
ncbi:MAG: 3-phosphoserine/phosphohydroxythreonine transaminase [Gammaproteobacteria bacterium]